MGFILLTIQGVVSFVAGRMLVKTKPEILNWSINKKQIVLIGWFIFSVLVNLGIWSLQSVVPFEKYLFNSIGTSLLMSMAFNWSLKTSKVKIP